MRLPIDTASIEMTAPNSNRATVVVDCCNQALLISVENAATILGIGRTRTFELVMSNAVTSVKIGRRRLVVRSSLQEFVDQLTETQSNALADR